MKTNLFLLITYFILSSYFSVGQISPSLDKAWKKFDYKTFLKEYKKISTPSSDEQSLYVKVAYKEKLYDEAIITIDNLKLKSQLSDELKVLENDILIYQTYNSGTKIFEISSLSINSTSAEFASCLVDSTLYFSSSSTMKLGVKKVDIRTDKPFLDLFKVKVDKEKANFYSLKKVSSQIHNDGPIAINDKESALTVNYPNSRNRNLKVVFMDVNGVRSEFKYNDPSYSVGHVSYSTTGDTIIYASDLENKNGETDLYFSIREDADWSSPKKLNSNINTSGNEMFPFIVGEKLFFSSNGHGGKGLLDIYEVSWLNETSIPINLPYPINTNADDFGFITNDNGLTGYFSSNRVEGNDDDIFYFDRSKITFGCKEVCENQPCIQLEVKDFSDFDVSRFNFIWSFGDGETGEGVFLTHCYKEIGEYPISLSYEDKLTGVTRKDVTKDTIKVSSIVKNLPAFSLPDTLKRYEIYQIQDLSEIEFGQYTKSIWEIEDDGFQEVDLPEISFSSPGYKKIKRNISVGEENCCYQSYYNYTYVSEDIEPGFEKIAQEEIVKESGIVVEEDVFNVKILVVDENGKPVSDFDLDLRDEQGNLVLNEVVNDTVTTKLDISKNYSVSGSSSSGDLSTSLLSAEGKTESEFALFVYQVIPNNLPKYIVKTVDNNGEVVPQAYVIINNDTLAKTNANGLYTFNTIPKGSVNFGKYLYFENSIQSSLLKEGEVLDVVLTKVEADAIIRLDDIYFDLSKWNIRPDAAMELDKLVKLMKEYPTLEIELRAHTDARGSGPSNMSLSDKRAKSAAAYIVSKGIDGSRLQGKGYGETLLLNECKDGVRCSEEKHQWNRRVECKILKI